MASKREQLEVNVAVRKVFAMKKIAKGAQIREVRTLNGYYVTRQDQDVYNPAFDVVPGHLVTGFITEKGIVHGRISIESQQTPDKPLQWL